MCVKAEYSREKKDAGKTNSRLGFVRKKREKKKFLHPQFIADAIHNEGLTNSRLGFRVMTKNDGV